MGDKSRINWTDATWNPTVGCSRASTGCENCYAEVQAERLARFPNMAERYKGLTRRPVNRNLQSPPQRPRWTGVVRFVTAVLDQPIAWKKPRKIFVGSMSDLFHDKVHESDLDKIFAVMALCSGQRRQCAKRKCEEDHCEHRLITHPAHTFQLLTKRPENARSYLSDPLVRDRIEEAAHEFWSPEEAVESVFDRLEWPLPNVWLGTTAENQDQLERRGHDLVRTPAAVRWISAEPLLSALDFAKADLTEWAPCPWCEGSGTVAPYDRSPGASSERPDCWCARRWGRPGQVPTQGLIDWVVTGGESGRRARPCDVSWIREIQWECMNMNTACWVKQLGANPAGLFLHPVLFDYDSGPLKLKDPKGSDLEEWPEDLKMRETPRSTEVRRSWRWRMDLEGSGDE